MRKKLISNYILIILISIAITAGSFIFYGYSYLVQENEANLTSKVDILASFFEEQDMKTTAELSEYVREYSEEFDLRLTLIDEDGTVIADSEIHPIGMENHKDRPEVRRAMRQRKGSDHRFSDSLGVEYYYAAVRIKTDFFYGVIRASEPASAFQDLLDTLASTVCVIVILCIGIALALVYFYSRSVMEPIEYITQKAESIANGQYDGNILIDGEDEIARLATSFNKMTKTLHIEQDRVNRRKEELNSILTSMNSGVVALDNGGKILFYNESFIKLLGFEGKIYGDSILGESFYNYIRNVEILDIISFVEEEERPLSCETVFEYDDEETVVLIKGTPLYKKKKAKRKFGTLLIMEDVTRMKKLENMRKDFVSNVTHELKTPLTSIRGFVDTLKGGAIDDPVFARRFLDIIDIEAERLSILVSDILTLSEIESGTDKGKSMVNVERVIDEVIELLEKKGKANVAIIKDMEKPVTDYLCNQHRLKEIILNLADNGLKYTNEGSVTIKCWENDKDLMFQFIDTGVGIPKEHLPRLFERFYRVDKGRSRKQGGTGLGLSIVKNIVELYGGTVSVESEPGVGSIFTVKLPYYVG